MTYADARYEMLHIGIGMTKVVDGIAVTRWSEDHFELGTWGKSTQVLERALGSLGYFPDRENNTVGAMLADYVDETGCDYSTALVHCNCD